MKRKILFTLLFVFIMIFINAEVMENPDSQKIENDSLITDSMEVFSINLIKSIEVKDVPNDDGSNLIVEWELVKNENLFPLRLYRKKSELNKLKVIKELAMEIQKYINYINKSDYIYIEKFITIINNSIDQEKLPKKMFNSNENIVVEELIIDINQDISELDLKSIKWLKNNINDIIINMEQNSISKDNKKTKEYVLLKKFLKGIKTHVDKLELEKENIINESIGKIEEVQQLLGDTQKIKIRNLEKLNEFLGELKLYDNIDDSIKPNIVQNFYRIILGTIAYINKLETGQIKMVKDSINKEEIYINALDINKIKEFNKIIMMVNKESQNSESDKKEISEKIIEDIDKYLEQDSLSQDTKNVTKEELLSDMSKYIKEFNKEDFERLKQSIINTNNTLDINKIQLTKGFLNEVVDYIDKLKKNYVEIYKNRTYEYSDDGVLYKNTYEYFIVAFDNMSDQSVLLAKSQIISPKPNWFKKNKTILLLFIFIYTGIIIFLIETVKRGKVLFLRKIAGLDALDEAVGRATEMGRPILYVPGISSMSDIATIASLNILGPVAKKVAEYDSKIIVPNRDPIVMTVAREVVKEAYTEAGRPDTYNDNDVFFLTDSQFGYAAAVNGIMVREKPATNLFLGMFFAESLILAETGNTTGAIQIAGTDAVTQLPFFITSCDYTIIGEELYAASAYLSNEPLLMGSIKAQDYMKGFIILCILIFFVLYFINGVTGNRLDFINKLIDIIKFIYNT